MRETRHLERVEDGEEPGKDCGISVESEETKQPGESQQRQQDDCCFQECSVVR